MAFSILTAIVASISYIFLTFIIKLFADIATCDSRRPSWVQLQLCNMIRNTAKNKICIFVTHENEKTTASLNSRGFSYRYIHGRSDRI